MDCGIYLVTNTVNEKVYVGSSKMLKRRRGQHLSNLRGGRHTNPHFQRAFNTDGEEAFQWEILLYCAEADLIYWEDWFIRCLDSRNPDQGYNFWAADRHEASPETRAKMSASGKANKTNKRSTGLKQSDEMKEKLRAFHTGKQWSLGRAQPEETREKIAAKLRGKMVSEETRAKLSKANLGRGKGQILSEECRAKIKAGMKVRRESGIPKSTKGRKLSPEWCAKLSAAQTARWARIKSIKASENI